MRTASKRPPVLLPWNIVTRADKAEGVGDPPRLPQVLHRLRPRHGQVWVEQFGEVLLRRLLALLLRGELAPYPGQFAGIEPEASAPRALVDQDPAFDAVEVAHHDLSVPGAADALAQVRVERGVPLHLQELLARRLVRFVHARELEPVEPDPPTPPGAHVHRDALGLHLGHGVGAHRALDNAVLAGIWQSSGVRISSHLRPFRPFFSYSPDIVSTPQADVLKCAIRVYV